MRKNNNTLQEQQLNKKLKQLHRLLEELSSEFDIQYTFNYVLFEGFDISQEDMLYSQNITSNTLSYFLNNHGKLRNRIDNAQRLISNGNFLVICIEDSDKPKNYKDWIIEGETYIVKSIKYKENGGIFYGIVGKENPNNDGFPSNKFTKIISYSLN